MELVNFSESEEKINRYKGSEKKKTADGLRNTSLIFLSFAYVGNSAPDSQAEYFSVLTPIERAASSGDIL